MKRITLIALCMAIIAAASCGNNPKKKASVQEAVQNSAEVTESAPAEAPAAKAEKPKADAKKWYRQDFSLTEKMYVSGASMSRVYARKGNVLIFKMEGSQTTNLFVCTDSTRTGYLVNEGTGTYVKKSEKSDFDSVDEAIYDYLHSSMSNTLFGDRLKKNGEGVTAKDTTLFGRPAYVLTQEKTEDVVGCQRKTGHPTWKARPSR